MIEPRPRALVEQEVAQPRLAFGRTVVEQTEQRGLVAGPDLAQEQRVHDARGLDQPGKRLALVGRQRRHVGANLDRRKSGAHRLELLLIGRGLVGSEEHGARERDTQQASHEHEGHEGRHEGHEQGSSLRVRSSGGSVHAGAELQATGVGAKASDGALPHFRGGRLEDDVEIDVAGQPR